MSNWNNLNLYLTLDEQFQYTKKQLTDILIQSCIRGNKEEVVSAIKNGAYINCYDELQTPIMACVENSFFDLAQFLIKIGANPSVMVNDKDAIWLSLQKQSYDFLDLFYSNKCRQNPKKETGETPLIYATKNSDLRAVEIIAYKVNVNQKDNTGSTALHYNFMKTDPSSDDVAIAKILMACGADTNARNLEGISCQDISRTTENDMSSVLIEHEQISQIVAEPDNDIPDFDAEPPKENKPFKL